MRTDARRNGFTLVELLVALALLGLLSAMLFQGFASHRGIAREIAARNTDSATIEAAQSRLRDAIEAIVPITDIGGGQPRIELSGETASFEFFAPAALRLAPAPIDRVRIALERDGTLVLDRRSSLAVEDAEAMTREPLLTGVTALEFSYYGALSPNGVARWQPRWQAGPTLPQAVRVRVRFAGGGSDWPDLTVQPVATIDNFCRIDPETGRCRGRA